MRIRLSLLTAAAVSLLVPFVTIGGCGPSVSVEPEDGKDGGGGEGGQASSTSSGPIWDAGKDAFDEYVDPGCPDHPPPLQNFLCDPNNQLNSGCLPGEGCYIYVQYPSEPCGQEEYGAFCAPAGFGVQG